MRTKGLTTRWGLFAGLALVTLTGSAPSRTVDYPVKPVRVIVSQVAGGAVDIIARVMGQKE
jgi:tripartite-type tricarboxylate transporter receptor subunit TctC